MKRITLFLVILFSFTYPAVAAEKIRFIGNKALLTSDLAKIALTVSSKDSIIEAILITYQQYGYFEASAREEFQNGIRVIEIDEREPAIIDEFELSLDTSSFLKADFQKALDEFQGEIASEKALNAFAARCVDIAADNGRPYAFGKWTKIAYRDKKLFLTFQLIGGPKYHISGIKFNGIKRSRPEALLRILKYKIGDLFSQSRVRGAESQLNEHKYLGVISPFRVIEAGNGDSCLIEYFLNEEPSTRYDGAAGFSGKQGRDFSGRLELEFGDLLGTGRALSVFWSKMNITSNQLRFRYFEPFIFHSAFDASIEAGQTDRDTLFIETRGNLTLIYAPSQKTSGELSYSIIRNEPEGNSQVASVTKNIYSFRLSILDVDRIENPSAGHMAFSQIGYSYRQNRRVPAGLQNLPTRIIDFEAGAGYFHGISRNITMAFLAKSWGIVECDGVIPIEEIRYIGGFDNLRGYAFERFPSVKHAILTLEPRYLVGLHSRLYTFIDLGFFDSFYEEGSNYNLYPGFGFGIVAKTAIGQTKLEFSWGKSGFPSELFFNLGIASGL